MHWNSGEHGISSWFQKTDFLSQICMMCSKCWLRWISRQWLGGVAIGAFMALHSSLSFDLGTENPKSRFSILHKQLPSGFSHFPPPFVCLFRDFASSSARTSNLTTTSHCNTSTPYTRWSPTTATTSFSARDEGVCQCAEHPHRIHNAGISVTLLATWSHQTKLRAAVSILFVRCVALHGFLVHDILCLLIRRGGCCSWCQHAPETLQSPPHHLHGIYVLMDTILDVWTLYHYGHRPGVFQWGYCGANIAGHLQGR